MPELSILAYKLRFFAQKVLRRIGWVLGRNAERVDGMISSEMKEQEGFSLSLPIRMYREMVCEFFCHGRSEL